MQLRGWSNRYEATFAVPGRRDYELDGRVAEVLNEQAEEIERLRAIVGKYPKCWRLNDAGKRVRDAAVVPGETCFVPALGVWQCVELVLSNPGESHSLNPDCLQLCSTLAAADAAGGK